ncbi:MAG: YfcE family phosphodiesterase [Treponema sp.]|nr:YfcE family phosphodiesterase [Treponema sp.]
MENKKLLVLSDSHGDITALKAVLNWTKNYIPPNDTICAAAFLGDGLSDLKKAADVTGFYSDWKCVSGNNDYGSNIQDALAFDYAEHRFFICHGHRYSLYGGHHALLAAARINNADIALFGHSHVPHYKTTDGIKLINPGSIGRPRSRIGATFAVIECPEGRQINVEFYGIGDGHKIEKLNV